MTLENGRWVLVEFIGGPIDGRLSAIDASTMTGFAGGFVDLVSAFPGYRPARAPDAPLLFDQWTDRERAAIASFDQGAPELYLQLVAIQQPRIRPAVPANGAGFEEEDRFDSERFFKALLEGREEEAESIMKRQIAGGISMTRVIESTVAPALTTIGEAWCTGDLAVHTEHRATAIVERLLAAYGPSPAPGVRGRAVVASLIGDQHSLPTTMATMALREDGWQVDHLGCGVPSEDLLGDVPLRKTDLIVLSVTLESNRPRSIETASLLRKRGPAVLVGGPGQGLRGLQRAAKAVVRSG
ncbi:MAG: cobalamin B12-binding domain-containing protein [Acidimicrobiales bacterium]